MRIPGGVSGLHLEFLAFKQREAETRNFLGEPYQDVPQSFGKAVPWFRDAAARGDPGAQVLFGCAYLDGRGVAKNYDEAAKWFLKSAEQGNAEAQFNLGLMYAVGQGVRRDNVAATAWYRKAADQGHPAAQCEIGVMYAIGHDVPQSYILAHMWLSLAVAQGDELARRSRDRVAGKMTPAQLAEAQALAAEWKPVTEGAN